MLLPESMSRIVIVGTRTRMEDAINAFYGEKSIHIIDHTTGDDGLSIGAPTANTSKASERLIKVRAIEKELGINKHTKTANVEVSDVQSRIAGGDVEGVEDEVLKTVDARNDLTQKITELNSKLNVLTLLKKLNGPTLDLYGGYKSITVLVGTTTSDASAVQIENAEVISSFDKKEGGVVAVFVKNEAKDQAVEKLNAVGFTEVQVPAYTEQVTVDAACANITAEIESANAEIKSAEETLAVLKEKYAAFLRGSDEELAIEVEKGSVPLRIAMSKYTYIMDAWVPAAKVDSIKANLERKLGDDVHVEFEETRGRKIEESEHQEARFQNVPAKMNNGRIVCEYEYATSLLGIPKYQEIDPTFLIAIFLPLFFGLMIGDCGYAIPFIIIGIYGLKKTKHKDWRSIALVFLFGGIWAFLFGLFFYGEMLGMHFVGMGIENGVYEWHHNSVAVGGPNVSWDWLLGETTETHKLYDFFSTFVASVGPYGATDPDTFGVGVGKLEDVAFMLKLSVYIGVIHLLIGMVCAIVNVTNQHGFKEAILEKGGLLFTFIGVLFMGLALTGYMFSGNALTEGTGLVCLILMIVFLVAGIGLNIKAEGAMQAIMGLPESVGWILSYTRLGAIAMSKAGMALAFNYIVFGMIVGFSAGSGTHADPYVFAGFGKPAMLIIGAVIFSFLHLVVWTLGILSAGLHALRLQFVELLQRFYTGGDVVFTPLKEERKKTFFNNINKIKEA